MIPLVKTLRNNLEAVIMDAREEAESVKTPAMNELANERHFQAFQGVVRKNFMQAALTA